MIPFECSSCRRGFKVKAADRVLWAVLCGLLVSVEVGRTGDGPNYTLIREGLYLGGYVKAPPPGTKAVLNLCRRADPYKVEAHVTESIKDTTPAPSIDWLRKQ